MGENTPSNDQRHLDRAPGPPRTVLQLECSCTRCGGGTEFDGNGGEWCPRCRTSNYVTSKRRLYQLVEVEID